MISRGRLITAPFLRQSYEYRLFIFQQFMTASQNDEAESLIDYKNDERIVCYGEDVPFPLE